MAFDFGASVDHIPVASVVRDGQRVEFTREERQARVDVTRENASQFIDSAKARKVAFTPVGTIQGLVPQDFAKSVQDYYEFGYRHMAIGGLVPRKTKEVETIVKTVMAAVEELPERPWIHLFGVYRPKLQAIFRELKVDSFDSASYFRKSWLRSDQNYLGADGHWYAAIRVPMTSDGRTRKRLIEANADIERLEQQEREALKLLSQYDRERVSLGEVLDAVLAYDRNLARSSETKSMLEKYKRTLTKRPWRECKCNFCEELGIHMLIFRGSNRNKRRGAHNTLMLYGSLAKSSQK